MPGLTLPDRRPFIYPDPLVAGSIGEAVTAVEAEIVSAISTHEAAVDPHSGYVLDAALVPYPLGLIAVATRSTNLGIFTAEWPITGLSFTETLASNRIYYVHSFGHAISTVATFCIARIKIGGATVFERVNKGIDGINGPVEVDGYLVGPTSGASAFTVTYEPGAGNMTFGATAERLAYLALVDVGAVP